MGKKTKAERRAAHGVFEQQRAAKATAPGKDDVLPVDQIRMAAQFTMSTDPITATAQTGLTEKALGLIIEGRIDPTIRQSRAIVTTARGMNWEPGS